VGFFVSALIGFAELGAMALGGGIAGLSLGGALLSGALLVGATALARSLQKAQPAAAAISGGSGSAGFSGQPQPTDVQQTLMQAVPPRRRHYGRVKTGGYVDFFGSVSGVLYRLIMLGSLEVHAFEEHWLNDQQVLLGDLPSVTETAFGTKVTYGSFDPNTGSGYVPSPITYGYNLSSSQTIDFATVYPTTLTDPAQTSGSTSYAGGARWGFAMGTTAGFSVPYTGTITVQLYAKKTADAAFTLLGTISFTNTLAPQYIESSDTVTTYDVVKIVLNAGVPASSGTALGIGDLDVTYGGAVVGNSVVSTVSGGTLGSDPFTTTLASKTVSVYHPSHGFSTGAALAFNGIPAAVNGIPTSEFETARSITKVDVDNYTMVMTTAASAAGEGGESGARWRKVNSGTSNNYFYDSAYRVKLYPQMGEDDQAAQKTLIDAFPAIWGVYHRLAGITNVLCAFQDVPQADFSSVYPQGIPGYRAVLAGAKIYDPRDEAHDSSDKTTWEWSDNAACVILDFLTHADGMGRDRTHFNEASFATAADVCDESVSLKSGGSEARYRISASYDLTERPSDVLTRLLAACDGYLYPTADGTWGLRVGKWYAPTVTIPSSAILEYSMQQGTAALAQFNQLKLTYTDPNNDYQETEAEPWEDAASILKYGTLTDQLKLLEVPSTSQVRRLGKIASAKSNPEWRGTIKTSMAGLAAMGEAVVNVALDELDIDTTFLVTNFQIAGDLSHCIIEISSLAASAYEWDADTEEGTPPATQGSNTPLQVPDTPTGFSVIAAQIIVQGATVAAAAATSWDVPDRDTLSHEIQYKLTSDHQWASAAVPAGTEAWKSGVLNDGESYDFRLRAIGPGGAPSGWTSTATVVMTADTAAPGAPTGLTSSLATTTATIQWTNPSNENFYATKIYRGVTATFASASLIDTVYGGIGLTKSVTNSGLAVGTYYWWAVAVNASDVASAATGPTTQTVV
jgi:hypothetical protein